MHQRALASAVRTSVVVLLAAACAGDPLQPEPSSARMAAQSSGSGTTSRFTMPVEATMLGGTCGLAADVHLVGEITLNVHVTQTGTGRLMGHVISTARGTGAGADGSRYRFSYTNAARIVDFVGEMTPDNPPYTAYVVDRFQLSGLAGAPNVNTHMLFTIRLDENGIPTVLRDEDRNQACDPI